MADPRSSFMTKAVCGISPKTPNQTAFSETGNLPLQITPLESIETERDPETPHKDPTLKKKSGKLVSKRKLFLQNGQSLQINKAKKYNASKTANVQPQGEPGSKANYPLTERQQLQYLLEVTAKEVRQDFESSNCDDLPSNSSKTKKRNIAKDNQIEARIRKRNERGETSLHVAAIKGDLEDVVALIKAGAVVNAKDNAGWTPLHEACNYGNLRIVQELVWSGADVSIPGYEAITPLHDAVINDHTQVVKFLLDNGADPKMQTSHNYSTLDLARSAEVRNLLSSEQGTKDSETTRLQDYHYPLPQAKEVGKVSEEQFHGEIRPLFQESVYNETFNNFLPVHVDESNLSKVIPIEVSPDKETLTFVKPRDSEVSTESHWEGKVFTVTNLQETSQRENKGVFVVDNKEPLSCKEAASIMQVSLRETEEESTGVNGDGVALLCQQTQICSMNSDELKLNGNTEVVNSQNITMATCVSGLQSHNVVRDTASAFTAPNTFEESIATETLIRLHAGKSFSTPPGLPVTQEVEEDTPAPEKLNECLDKAIIEISSYLETSKEIPYSTDKILKQTSTMPTGNEPTYTETSQSSDLDASVKVPEESPQAHHIHRLGHEQHATNVLSSEAAKKAKENVADNSFEQQSVANFTKIKPRNEKRKEVSGVEKNIKSSRRKRTSTRSSESNPSSSVKEECTSHIANPTWRSELAKYKYSWPTMQLCVPGYEDFLINSKNCHRTKISSNELNEKTPKERQLDQLVSQHDTEKVKLRMTLEQELVRLFGNFTRKKAGYAVPYGACTVLTSQMGLNGVKKARIQEEEPASIKAEVDKILSKFKTLKGEMLRRHHREIETVVALRDFWPHAEDLTTDRKFWTRTWRKDDSRSFYGEDFELIPAKFAEYYDEVLCAPD